MVAPLVAGAVEGTIARAGASQVAKAGARGKVVEFTQKYKSHRLSPPAEKGKIDKALEVISQTPNIDLNDIKDTANKTPNEGTGQSAKNTFSMDGKFKDLFKNLPYPKSGIAIVLTLILFIIFAIQPVELEDGTKATRLKLLWKTLLGRTSLEGYSEAEADPSGGFSATIDKIKDKAYNTGKKAGESMRDNLPFIPPVLNGLENGADIGFDLGKMVGSKIGGWVN